MDHARVEVVEIFSREVTLHQNLDLEQWFGKKTTKRISEISGEITWS
jgi:hypothetical protein